MLTVVTGPPCSGKTTYVRERAEPGDIVIDFDDIAEALGSPVRHGHDSAVRHVTRAARSAAITAAIECHKAGRRVWVVDCEPPAGRRQQYHRARARMVQLAVGIEELHRRAEAERPELWHELIDGWHVRRASATVGA